MATYLYNSWNFLGTFILKCHFFSSLSFQLFKLNQINFSLWTMIFLFNTIPISWLHEINFIKTIFDFVWYRFAKKSLPVFLSLVFVHISFTMNLSNVCIQFVFFLSIYYSFLAVSLFRPLYVSLFISIYLSIYLSHFLSFSVYSDLRGSLNKFPDIFFVWALLLIVHTWNSSLLPSNLLQLQCTCCTIPTTSARPHWSPLVSACQWPSSQPLSSPHMSHNNSLWA